MFERLFQETQPPSPESAVAGLQGLSDRIGAQPLAADGLDTRTLVGPIDEALRNGRGATHHGVRTYLSTAAGLAERGDTAGLVDHMREVGNPVFNVHTAGWPADGPTATARSTATMDAASPEASAPSPDTPAPPRRGMNL